MVVLHDHLHALWQLPEGDADFSTHWRLVKTRFARAIPRDKAISPSRERRGERGIWQRRFWEHRIRDEDDRQRHIDSIHFIPFKQGLVEQAADWPYSSFRGYARGLA